MRDWLREPITRADFDAAAGVIGDVLAPTPQIVWPLLARRAGCELWLKHENHLPTGAFKVRGGLWMMHCLAQTERPPAGVIAATRGNHGQSIAFAAARHGLRAVIVVPHGNNPEKNRAMQALGAELIEHGEDFDAALAHAALLAQQQDLWAVPSWAPVLVQGVGTYACELLDEAGELDRIYVPVGLGSGVCGVAAACRAMSCATEVVGVVAAGADGYARSMAAGRVEGTDRAETIADGLAVRTPSAPALAMMQQLGVRIMRVSDAAIMQAIAILLEQTHNLAEGAGAAALAAALDDAEHNAGRRIGVVLSGGNLDRTTLQQVLDR